MKNALVHRLTLAFVLLAAGSQAFAHAGHDHSHWSSPAVHALLFISVTAVVGLASWAYRTYQQKPAVSPQPTRSQQK